MGSVLLVDDERDVQRVVGLILKMTGYEVIEAADEEEALEALKSGEDSPPSQGHPD